MLTSVNYKYQWNNTKTKIATHSPACWDIYGMDLNCLAAHVHQSAALTVAQCLNYNCKITVHFTYLGHLMTANDWVIKRSSLRWACSDVGKGATRVYDSRGRLDSVKGRLCCVSWFECGCSFPQSCLQDVHLSASAPKKQPQGMFAEMVDIDKHMGGEALNAKSSTLPGTFLWLSILSLSLWSVGTCTLTHRLDM